MRVKLSRHLKDKRVIAALIAVVALSGLAVHHYAFQPVDPYASAVPTAAATAATSIKHGHVSLLTFRMDNMTVYAHERNGHQLAVAFPANDGLKSFLALGRKHKVPVENDFKIAGGSGSSGGRMQSLALFLPLLLLGALVIMMFKQMRGGRGMKVESSTSNVDFKDIAGCGEVVEELSEVRDFLKSPKKYTALGAKVPKGVLLHGPPGTGKTLVAKAIAKEAGIPFFSVSGSDFVEMYVGLGARRVRNLFAKAKKQSPCIIFIDEIDALGRARGGAGDGSSREADQTLNSLLVEMDGFEVGEHPIIVIGATNRIDHLDPALLRPGRFDRQLAVDPPDRAGRLDILRLHANGKALGDVDLEELAAKSSGMTGAELANVLNEAAILAAREGVKAIEQHHLHDALVRVIVGAKKQNQAMNESERRAVAYHEVGHALAAELLDSPSKVEQVSIEPRGRSLGHMMFSDAEEIALESKSGLMSRIVVMLAGRAAEELVIEDITAGAQDDLQKATRLVTAMLTQLGMGHELGLYVIDEGKDLPKEVREEVKAFLAERYRAAKTLLEDNVALMDKVADVLLAEETISRKRFLEVIGKVDTPRLPAKALVAAVPKDV
jgi:cell division protease FtsH